MSKMDEYKKEFYQQPLPDRQDTTATSHRFHMRADFTSLPFITMIAFTICVTAYLVFIVTEAPHLLSRYGDPRDVRRVNIGDCVRPLGNDDQYQVLATTHTHVEIKDRLYGTKQALSIETINRQYVREACQKIIYNPYIFGYPGR